MCDNVCDISKVLDGRAVHNDNNRLIVIFSVISYVVDNGDDGFLGEADYMAIYIKYFMTSKAQKIIDSIAKCN